MILRGPTGGLRTAARAVDAQGAAGIAIVLQRGADCADTTHLLMLGSRDLCPLGWAANFPLRESRGLEGLGVRGRLGRAPHQDGLHLAWHPMPVLIGILGTRHEVGVVVWLELRLTYSRRWAPWKLAPLSYPWLDGKHLVCKAEAEEWVRAGQGGVSEVLAPELQGRQRQQEQAWLLLLSNFPPLW